MVRRLHFIAICLSLATLAPLVIPPLYVQQQEYRTAFEAIATNVNLPTVPFVNATKKLALKFFENAAVRHLFGAIILSLMSWFQWVWARRWYQYAWQLGELTPIVTAPSLMFSIAVGLFGLINGSYLALHIPHYWMENWITFKFVFLPRFISAISQLSWGLFLTVTAGRVFHQFSARLIHKGDASIK